MRSGSGLPVIFQVEGNNDAQQIIDGAIRGVLSSVMLKADPGNSGIVYIGTDDELTASNGFPLDAGDGLAFEVVSVNNLWFHAGAGDSLAVMAVGTNLERIENESS